MSDKRNVFERLRESFNKIDGQFHVLEQQVPVELQMEYFKYSERLRKKAVKIDESDYYTFHDELCEKDVSAERKKYILAVLATSNQVKAFRILEEYARHPEPEVSNWAYMALMESRISLESELLDKKQIYISTGLGGKGEKLRFYVLLFASENKPFEEYQKQVIEREFAYALPKDACEIERLTMNDVYVELVFLVPVRVDIKTLLENVISECNQYGSFLSPVFTVTNVKELSSEEIASIIKKKYGGDKAAD